MKKFQQNMNRELKRQYPDRRKLEAQCISAVAFGGEAGTDLLDCPIWVLSINIVAMEMLRSKMPMGEYTCRGQYSNDKALFRRYGHRNAQFDTAPSGCSPSTLWPWRC